MASWAGLSALITWPAQGSPASAGIATRRSAVAPWPLDGGPSSSSWAWPLVAYHMPIPIVSAVGHDVDQPLIQDVVHWAFAAPTALGTWLADRAKGAIHAREAMALDHTRALEAMQRQLTELSEVATAAKLSETAAREATVAMQRQLPELSEAVTAAKLAETAARDAAAQAREEAMVLRLDLQKSESRRRTMQYMSAVLLVVLVMLVFMLVL
jgi:exonuclease VII large subunit